MRLRVEPNGIQELVVFTLDEQRYAVPLSAVQRVIRSVEISPLPKAPEIVMGVINLQGRIIPVVNIRKRFRLPERQQDLDDHIIAASTSRRVVGILVDGASGVVRLSDQEVVQNDAIVPGMEFVSGVVKLNDGMVLIHDLDRFLSLEEESKLDQALVASAR